MAYCFCEVKDARGGRGFAMCCFSTMAGVPNLFAAASCAPLPSWALTWRTGIVMGKAGSADLVSPPSFEKRGAAFGSSDWQQSRLGWQAS